MSDGFPLSLRDVRRTFQQGDRKLEVLRGITLDLRAGEIVALVGQSGSGKSTLLHIAGLLERPDGGEVMVDGKAAGKLGDGARDRHTLLLAARQPARPVVGAFLEPHHR